MSLRIADAEWQEFSRWAALESLLNDFGSLTYITLCIIDPDGKRLCGQTPPHNQLCMELIKPSPLGGPLCDECDIRWSRAAEADRTYKVYTCTHGLVDFVSPIMIDGEAVGYLFGGQLQVAPDSLSAQQCLSDEEISRAIDAGTIVAPPRSWHVRHAGKLGIPSAEYLKALDAVRCLPMPDIESAARILHAISGFLSRLFSRWLRETRELHGLEEAVEKLRDEARTRTGIGDMLKWALESKAVSREILGELRKKFPYRRASLQLIQNEARILLAGEGFDDMSPDSDLLLPVPHDPLVRRIVASQRPLVLSDPSKDPDWGNARAHDIRSWIGLPVVYDQQVIGLFTLDHDETGFYQTDSRAALQEFADQVAPKIWHAWMWNAARRLIRDFEIVNEVVKAMSANLETHDLLKTITSQIAEKLHCTHCTIFFPETENGRLILVPKEAHGGSAQTLTRRFEPGSPDEGLAGLVFRTGQSLVLADAREHTAFAGARRPSLGPRSMMVAAVKVGDQTIGVISADQDEPGWFGESDLRLVDLLAQHVGIAIQRSRALKLLQDIGHRIIRRQRVKEILEEVVAGAMELTNTSAGVIYLASDDGKVLETFAAPGFDHPPPRLDKEDGLTRTVLREGRVIRIPDVPVNSRVHPHLRAKFQSLIAVPLNMENKVIGVFYLNDESPHVFTQTEESLLLTLATEAAIAIEQARLIQNLQNQAKIRSILEAVLQRLVVRQQDQVDALNCIGDGIRELLGEEVSPTINFYDEETDRFSACRAYGPLANHLRDEPRNEGGTGRHVLKTGEPLYLEDVRRPPKDCPTIRWQSIELGIQSFAAIPLIRQHGIVGVLFVNSEKQLCFDDEIRRVLEIFATQAGIAIEIAYLHTSEQISAALVKGADMGFLASGIAHEYYNGLQNMLSILSDFKPSGKQQTVVDKLRSEIDRAVRSIDLFRSFRDRGENAERVSLSRLARDVVTMIDQRAKHHGIQIVCRDVSDVEVRIDPTRVQSILVNLLRNAMDAVETVDHEKRIEIEIRPRENQEILLVVRDNGPGISPAARDKLFFPFFTSKGPDRMGIGLSLVRRIVEEMSGRIEVDPSNAWGGATFGVFLPTVEEPHEENSSRG
jgi:GAF domain-containing protein/two-component sensor histidine kinase